MCAFNVRRNLQTVGMTTFVTHFTGLSNDALSSADLVELIANENISEVSALTKASAGRRIIRSGYAEAALRIIAESSVVASEISQKARQLLESDSAALGTTEHSSENQIIAGLPAEVITSNKRNWSEKVDYQTLNARQKESYNTLKLGAVLADYGFDLIRLNDDWQGADCIANHIDGNTFLKVQLKGRPTIDKKYLEKDIYIAFREGNKWYLYPHDELIELLQGAGIALQTDSWIEKGHYSWPKLTERIKEILSPYLLD